MFINFSLWWISVEEILKPKVMLTFRICSRLIQSACQSLSEALTDCVNEWPAMLNNVWRVDKTKFLPFVAWHLLSYRSLFRGNQSGSRQLCAECGVIVVNRPAQDDNSSAIWPGYHIGIAMAWHRDAYPMRSHVSKQYIIIWVASSWRSLRKNLRVDEDVMLQLHHVHALELWQLSVAMCLFSYKDLVWRSHANAKRFIHCQGLNSALWDCQFSFLPLS